jgi:hypothetical protein
MKPRGTRGRSGLALCMPTKATLRSKVEEVKN